MEKQGCTKTKANTVDKKFWDERWKEKDTGWDLSDVSPPLKEYIDSIKDKNIRILIPGCGNAYEAEYLLEHEFSNVTVIDIAPTLVQQLLQKFESYAGKELTIICGDFFKHQGKYDLILEQTFFCALSPSLRKNYVETMNALLSDEGKLAGLLFNKQFENNPPFGGSREEYMQLFGEKFKIEKMDDCANSVAPRMGAELFVELSKK
ncbi:MAG: Thiopurine S-methyltransferase family protein [Bacteroidota bacterium]|nr:Thiopurine S-methyltransferase family protein [Bacteroidota bacterium]